MKSFHMLIWLTQLGLSIAMPLAGFILFAVWLQQRFDLGSWILIVGVFLGISGAIDGFRLSLKAMEQMAKKDNPRQEPPPLSFNDHT